VGYAGASKLLETTMARGTVKWFNGQKGYGFIQPQDGSRDVFIHISAVERAGLSGLNEGQVVEYELVTNRGKTSAENLKVSRWALQVRRRGDSLRRSAPPQSSETLSLSTDFLAVRHRGFSRAHRKGRRMVRWEAILSVAAALLAFVAAIFWFFSAHGDVPQIVSYYDRVPDSDPFLQSLRSSALMNKYAASASALSAFCWGANVFLSVFLARRR
jgi:cold shock protein